LNNSISSDRIYTFIGRQLNNFIPKKEKKEKKKEKSSPLKYK
jgi:hypothetical protein